MTNFSTNQVMQMFVCTDGAELVIEGAKKLQNGGVSFLYTVNGEPAGRTDVIENIKSATYTVADELAKAGKAITIKATEVIPGQTYVVRVKYPEVAGLGTEGYTTKTAVFTVGSEDATAMYTAMAKDFNVQFKADGMMVAKVTDEGLVIYQDLAKQVKYYKRGLRPVVVVDFEVTTNNVVKEGDDFSWAEKTTGTAEFTVGGGYKLADMEYFAMGERGDQYRMVDYVNAIDTEYKVVPTAEYDVVNIHYAHADNNTTIQEKDLVVVVAAGQGEEIAGALADVLGVEIKATKVE